jgi:hypothetical protein
MSRLSVLLELLCSGHDAVWLLTAALVIVVLTGCPAGERLLPNSLAAFAW